MPTVSRSSNLLCTALKTAVAPPTPVLAGLQQPLPLSRSVYTGIDISRPVAAPPTHRLQQSLPLTASRFIAAPPTQQACSGPSPQQACSSPSHPKTVAAPPTHRFTEAPPTYSAAALASILRILPQSFSVSYVGRFYVTSLDVKSCHIIETI